MALGPLLVLALIGLLGWALILAGQPAPPRTSKPRPKSRAGKTVTISGRPVEIRALQNFRVVIQDPSVCNCSHCSWYVNPLPPRLHPRCRHNTFKPVIDLYTTVLLEGLLLRKITGGAGPVSRVAYHAPSLRSVFPVPSAGPFGRPRKEPIYDLS